MMKCRRPGGRGGAGGGTAGASAGGAGGAAGASAGGTGGGAAGAGAGGGGTAGAQACNTTVNTGTAIPETRVADVMPTNATGGTILPGTYHQISHTIYTGIGGATGPNGSTRKTTAVIASTAGGFTEQFVASVDGGADQRFSFEVTVNGTMLNLAVTCPGGNPLQFGYSVVGDTIIVFNTDASAVEVHQRAP